MAKFTCFIKLIKLTPTIDLTTLPFISDIYIDRSVLATNNKESANTDKVSLPKSFGNAILSNLTNFKKKS